MTDPDARADELVSAWWEARERGEPLELEEVVTRHPDLADAIRLRGAALELLRRALADEAPEGVAHPGPAGAGRLTGRTLGPYRVVAEIGAGGMGRVYRAELSRPAAGLGAGAVVALKVVHPHLLESEGFFRRFVQEAEIGRRIAHENVVRTLAYDAIVSDGVQHNFLVLEHVEGQTLRSLLTELGAVPEDLCRHVAREVARGLSAIHAAGALHRDLKPENVILTRDHAVKVMDLGVARLEGESLRISRTGLFVGSVGYASPEQLRPKRGPPDERSDLFALGAMLYELSAGEVAFPGSHVGSVVARILECSPRPLSEVSSQVSPFFESLVHALLERDPERRPGSAAEVAEILDAGEAGAWWRAHANAARSARAGSRPRSPLRPETALHGRDAELAALRALFARVRDGEGQVVLVEGEAGIGKTRLVDELVRGLELDGEEFQVLDGSYPPGGAATAWGAFAKAYGEHFGSERLDEAVLAYVRETPLLAPAFGAFLRGAPAPRGSEALTKDGLQAVFLQATRALAGERPTIVRIEDLHFAPDEGRGLFTSLGLGVPGHRILLIGSSRPGQPEGWTASLGRIPHLTRMTLGRLGRSDLTRLLAEALRSEHLAEELFARIAEKSDGNPYFVFEILRSLRERRALERRPDGTWVSTGASREIEIPSSLAEVVQARFAGLAPDERELLDLAACVGFRFDPTLVGEAVGLPRLVTLRRLARIERAQRLLRSEGLVCVFDHHQVQETLYAGIPDALRAEYHGAIADALERRSGVLDRPEETCDGDLCVELCDHLLRAGRGTAALRYLDRALSHLAWSHATAQGIALCERALALPGLLEGTARLKVLLARDLRLDLRAERAAQEVGLAEAQRLAEASDDPQDRVHVASGLGNLLWRTGRLREAHAQFELARGLCRETADARGEALAELSLGSVNWSLGRFEEAKAHIEAGLRGARTIGDASIEARAVNNLGTVLWSLGRNEEALAQHQRAEALHAAGRNRRGEANAIGGQGLLLWATQRFEEARVTLSRALAIHVEIGDREGEPRVRGNLGNVLWSLCRYAEAQACYARTLAISEETGDLLLQSRVLGNLGGIFQTLGATDPAWSHHERALAIARRTGDRQGEGHLLQQLGVVAEQAGRLEQAESLHREALRLARSCGHRSVVYDALASLGALLLDQGRTAEAVALEDEALALARELANPAAVVAAACQRALAPGGDAGAAVEVFTTHEARLGLAEAMAARFMLWTATGDPVHLADAGRRLDLLVEGAPRESRGPMVENVRLHREILRAVRDRLPPR